MAKAKFERTKPHCNIGTIGHVDHGKTTLTAAITKILGGVGWGADLTAVRPDRQGAGGEGARDHDLDGARRVRDGQPSLRARGLPGPRGLREEHDHGRGADGRRDPGCVGGGRPDAADARAHSAGAPGWRSGDGGLPEQGGQVDDEELLELVELEVRELLSSYEFPGDDIPIVKGSALAALGGRDDSDGQEARSWS